MKGKTLTASEMKAIEIIFSLQGLGLVPGVPWVAFSRLASIGRRSSCKVVVEWREDLYEGGRASLLNRYRKVVLKINMEGTYSREESGSLREWTATSIEILTVAESQDLKDQPDRQFELSDPGSIYYLLACARRK